MAENIEAGTEINKAKRTNLYKVDPRSIVFDNNTNPRKAMGDMDSLKLFIKENGTDALPPIMVKKFKDDEGNERYTLIHGYRRMNAINELLSEGSDIARVKAECVLQTFNENDELVAHLSQNSGKPLTPFEEATIYNQLESNGYAQAEIARKVGRTPAHISNMLKITKCTKRVQNAMEDGIISPSLVLKIMNKHGDNADSVIATAIATARTLSKTRVTEKIIDSSVNDTPHKPKQSRYAKAISLAIVIGTEKNNEEELGKLRKAEQIVSIFDTTKSTEEIIDKLLEVM